MATLTYRILVVEQDISTRSQLEEIFFEHNLEFEFAQNPDQGIKKIAKAHFDLVISDYDFGEGNPTGIDLLIKIRESQSELPFILITSVDRTDKALEAINYGISGSLEKPIEAGQAAEITLRAIRHQKSRQVDSYEGIKQVTNYFSAIITSTEQAALQLVDRVESLMALVYPSQQLSFPELRMAIYESLANAVEHGNQANTNSQIFFELEMKPDRIIAHIKDEGSGFETQNVLSTTSKIQSSRGLRLISHLMDEVSFNIKGNEINLLKLIPKNPER